MTWTRAHQRCLEAAAVLCLAGSSSQRNWSFGEWLKRNFGVSTVAGLTIAQARKARRSLNAWRAGDYGVRHS